MARKKRQEVGETTEIRQMMDVRTGEVIDVLMVTKGSPSNLSDDGFVKMWLKPFCAALNAFAIKKIDVFAYLIKRAEHNPVIYERISDIAKAVGCSDRVVIDCLHLMEDNDIIKRNGNRALHFNENVMFRGNANKRAFMYVQYRDTEPTARVMKVQDAKLECKRRHGTKEIEHRAEGKRVI